MIARGLKPLALLILPLALGGPALAAPSEAGEAWDVTFALRIDNGRGRPVQVRVALPPDTPTQRVSNVRISSRGLKTQTIQGEQPEVLFNGVVRKSRRVAVSYTVTVTPEQRAIPAIDAPADPPLDLYSELSPAPLFPSRSILVREFLEENVTPLLADEDRGVLRAIYDVTRSRLRHDTAGKSLPLDVLRRGFGQRIGLERLFTTFLRCARIPARFVEGIKLDSSTRRKRFYWTEAWSQDAWWPASVSRGWIGKRPTRMVALTYDGRRPVQIEGEGAVSYTVQARLRSAS
jgi:hypothetical protein